MSQLTYQVNLSNSLEMKENYYSPVFSTYNNMFWQLLFQSEDESYGLYLKPVADPDEVTWRGRLKLSYKIFIKEIKDNHTTELCNSNLVIPPDTKIIYGFGCSKVFKKSVLQNGELIIGVTIKNLDYKEGFSKAYSPNSIPKNLIDAWKDQLFDYQPADVEFNVQGEKFYACSSILSKRSEYFAKILSGQWSESTVVQGDDDDNDENDNNDDVTNDSKVLLKDNLTKNNEISTHRIKHRIEIYEYDSITFSSMLEYLYTNQVKWTNKDKDSIAVGLFRLADQYLLSDLRERAKIRILNELNLSNVSEIMFNLASRYEDLKGPVLKFMAKNFEEINNSQEFKNVLANLVNYPNYNVVLSEIWAEFFKIQKVK